MTVSITLWEAYLLESLRSKGMDNETILTYIEQQDIQALNEFDKSFDHTDLIMTENLATIKQAIFSDYKVKFITVNGLKNLLNMKFGLQAGKDYEVDNSRFSNIPFSNDQLKTVETMISPIWKIMNITHKNDDVLADIIHASDIVDG